MIIHGGERNGMFSAIFPRPMEIVSHGQVTFPARIEILVFESLIWTTIERLKSKTTDAYVATPQAPPPRLHRSNLLSNIQPRNIRKKDIEIPKLERLQRLERYLERYLLVKGHLERPSIIPQLESILHTLILSKPWKSTSRGLLDMCIFNLLFLVED